MKKMENGTEYMTVKDLRDFLTANAIPDDAELMIADEEGRAIHSLGIKFERGEVVDCLTLRSYMEQYFIDWGNGITEDITGTLEDAKKAADAGAAYTGYDIVIRDSDWNEITRRSWWGVAYDPNVTEDTEAEVIQFGWSGHYDAWH